MEERKVSAPLKKWRNINPSAVSAFNYGWDTLLRGDRADFGSARFAPDLATEEVSGWTVVYGERRLLEPGEIARLVNEAISS